MPRLVENLDEELAATRQEGGVVRAQHLPGLFYNREWECWIAS